MMRSRPSVRSESMNRCVSFGMGFSCYLGAAVTEAPRKHPAVMLNTVLYVLEYIIPKRRQTRVTLRTFGFGCVLS